MKTSNNNSGFLFRWEKGDYHFALTTTERGVVSGGQTLNGPRYFLDVCCSAFGCSVGVVEIDIRDKKTNIVFYPSEGKYGMSAGTLRLLTEYFDYLIKNYKTKK